MHVSANQHKADKQQTSVCQIIGSLLGDLLRVPNLDMKVQVVSAEGGSVHCCDALSHTERAKDVLLHRLCCCGCESQHWHAGEYAPV